MTAAAPAQVKSVRRPLVKICCIRSAREACMAIDAGAGAIGLVSAMPSGPGVITDEEIRAIAATVPSGIDTFLLTSRTTPSEIVAQQKAAGTTTIQMVDSVSPEAHKAIRDALPSVKLVQVIHVAGEESLREAERIAQSVDAILLDSGNPSLPVKQLGGTGRTHDWSISARICVSIDVPVYLAGGLNPENVFDAVTTVHPFAVDVCSGVRTEQLLDPLKLLNFFKAVDRIPSR